MPKREKIRNSATAVAVSSIAVRHPYLRPITEWEPVNGSIYAFHHTRRYRYRQTRTRRSIYKRTLHHKTNGLLSSSSSPTYGMQTIECRRFCALKEGTFGKFCCPLFEEDIRSTGTIPVTAFWLWAPITLLVELRLPRYVNEAPFYRSIMRLRTLDLCRLPTVWRPLFKIRIIRCRKGGQYQ